MSNATKHTPGPWTLDQNSHIYGPYVEMNNDELALFYGADWQEVVRTTSGRPARKQHIASVQGKDARPGDASLIAAAPEMLDALRMASRSLLELARTQSECDALHAVNAAIARATN